jgi:2,3-bisphosphoglycerate-independent phosphoglycerate mutase
MSKTDQKACLIVIDGWGIPSAESPKNGDAITNAKTPVMDGLYKDTKGYTELEASSLAVGLPEGLMGNSEVGHLNIGAGRVVWQDVVRIDQTIKNGELSQNDVIKKTFQGAAAGNGRLHLCGLVSHGGVHAKQTHLYALLKAAKEFGVPKVFIHFFGDGRDTDPKSGAGYMQELVDTAKEIGIGEIGTVVGRYFAMDRDKRWDRLEIALKGLVHGEGEASDDPVATVKARYERGGDLDRDEFLTPIIVGGDERRIKGTLYSEHMHSFERHLTFPQTMTLSSSSTTDPTVSVKSPSFSVMSTDLLFPTSSTPRLSPLSP